MLSTSEYLESVIRVDIMNLVDKIARIVPFFMLLIGIGAIIFGLFGIMINKLVRKP